MLYWVDTPMGRGTIIKARSPRQAELHVLRQFRDDFAAHKAAPDEIAWFEANGFSINDVEVAEATA